VRFAGSEPGYFPLLGKPYLPAANGFLEFVLVEHASDRDDIVGIHRLRRTFEMDRADIAARGQSELIAKLAGRNPTVSKLR
jgi:hypothetical protein